MTSTYTLINTSNANQLFTNIKFAIEEIKLVRKISDLEELALQFQSSIPSKQTRFIRRKIDIAKARLELIRLKAEKQTKYRTLA